MNKLKVLENFYNLKNIPYHYLKHMAINSLLQICYKNKKYLICFKQTGYISYFYNNTLRVSKNIHKYKKKVLYDYLIHTIIREYQ